MPCELCISLPLNTRTVKRHERLQQVGLTRRISRPGRAKTVWLTTHRCELCETLWLHTDDPCDPHAGWSPGLTEQRAAELCA